MSYDPHRLRERYAAIMAAPTGPPIDPDRLDPEQRALWDTLLDNGTPDSATFGYTCSLYGIGDPLLQPEEPRKP